MSSKKQYSFPLIIIAIILGFSIYKNFNFETKQFDQLPLTVIYFLTFISSLYLLFKKDKDQKEE